MCCNFPTIKITEGNAFTLIFPLKRRSYVAERPIDEDIDVTRLTDVRVTLGGVEYAPTIETYGVRIDVPATLARGTYDGLLTADYDGNAIRGAYESCVQIVAWNAQSNAQQYILGSPVATKAAYVLGYMPTDEEVEALKQQLREQIAAAEQAETEAIAEKERYAEALEHLDDVAKESTLLQKSAAIIEAISGIHIDIPDNIATKDDVTAAKQAILDALSHIAPEDPNSKALAEFFGVTLLQGYEFMTDTEVTDELEDIMQALDPELEQEVEYPEGSGTYMTKAQAITAEAMQIINPSQS